MPDTDLLRNEIAAGRVVVICGAGVTMAATGSRSLSWRGLLHNALDYCELVTGGGTATAPYRHLLDTNDTDNLLAVATFVERCLGRPDGTHWARWLYRTFRPLSVTSRPIMDALKALNAPLVTLNYDDLLWSALNRWCHTWEESEAWLSTLRGEDNAILHLHGHYRRPASVVLGVGSYTDHKHHALAQHLERTLATVSTLLFVGCGGTFEDPNFRALLDWMRTNLAGATHRHFLLVRNCEFDRERAKYNTHPHLTVLGYGDDHEDLPGFLKPIAPAQDPVAVPIRLGWRRDLVDRESLLERLVNAILADDPPPIPVLGTPGIGKSALCRAALADKRITDRFGYQRWFVPLDGVTSGDALWKRCDEIVQPIDQSGDFFGLLVLDNLEVAYDTDPSGTEAAIEELVERKPGLVIVASMRGRIRPDGPRWADPIMIETLARQHAREQFLRRAGERFRDDPHLGQILDVLDDVPLAVELMAWNAQAESSLAPIWERWQQEGTGMLARPTEDRHRSFATALEVSLKSSLITPEARRLLALLGVIPDGLKREYLGMIMPQRGLAARTCLLQAGMIFESELDGRLRVLAPIRDYLAEHHRPCNEDLRSLIQFFLAFLEAVPDDVEEAVPADALAQLRVESGNLAATIKLTLQDVDVEQGIDAAVRFAGFQARMGIMAAEPLASAMMAAETRSDVRRHAACLLARGELARVGGSFEAARRDTMHALRLLKAQNDELGQAECLRSLATIALSRDRPNIAVLLLRRALRKLERASAPSRAQRVRARVAELEAKLAGDDRLVA